ncbi:hypothetical protein ACS0TY_030559 [Phlomoides rotata]
MNRCFTWYRPNGTCKSKLYRMFVNNEWIEKWSSQILRGLSKTISYHCPIFLKFG